MLKQISLILLTCLFLAACASGGAPTESTETVAPVGAVATEPAGSPQATLPPASTATTSPEPTQTLAAGSESIPTNFEPMAGCTAKSLFPTPDPTNASLFPPVSDADWRLGSPTAPVTFIVYSDFQCPYCASSAPMLAQLVEAFPEDVQLVYRHFPLIGTPEQPFHEKAAISAQAAEAAGLQGKFWEMHDLLMSRQGEWTVLSVEQFETWAVERAVELELNADQFQNDMTSEVLAAKIQAAWDDGVAKGLPGTPFVLLNGAQYNSGLDDTTLATVVQLTLLQSRQYTDCPPMVIDPQKQYFATIKTEIGDITAELYAEKSPLAVNNFVFLAREGWYDGVTFHRVISGFVAQAGDPSGTGYGGPGYAFKNEILPDLTFDRAGLLAMANAGADSNGSQFFITFAPLAQLNGNYTIFGRVIAGMDVAEHLAERDTSKEADLPPGDQILSITVEER